MISTLIQSILPLFFPFSFISRQVFFISRLRKRKKKKKFFQQLYSTRYRVFIPLWIRAGSRYELFSRVEARERASRRAAVRAYKISTHGFVIIIYGIIRGCSDSHSQLKDLISLRIFFKLINLTKTWRRCFHSISYSKLRFPFFQSFFLIKK